jgi:hypothetical protein
MFIMKLIMLVFVLFSWFTHVDAITLSRIHGTYQGKAYIESGTIAKNINASVKVAKQSPTVTTATISFRISGFDYKQLLWFREDGSVRGVVFVEGNKEATMKGTWTRNQNTYQYRGKVSVGRDFNVPIKGSLTFLDNDRLTVSGILVGDGKYKFRGTKP